MKRNILLLATLLIMQVSSFGQYIIENGGFEDWSINPVFGAEMPVGWLDGSPIPATKDPLSHSGNFAARIEVDGLSSTILSYGSYVCDTTFTNCFMTGNPFAGKPGKLGFWINYNTAGDDTVYILTQLTRWDFQNGLKEAVAEAIGKYVGNSLSYTYHEIEFDYLSSANPDTFLIFIVLGNQLSLTSTSGSYLLIDDMSLGGRTASGTVFNDFDSNGVQGVNENGIIEQIIKIEPGPFYTTTNNKGNFVYQIDSGVNYTISYVPLQYWDAYNSNLSYNVMANSTDTNIANLNFGIHPADSIIDIRISINSTRFRCAAESNIWIDYSNYGTTTESGTVELIIDPLLVYVRSTPPPDSISGNHYFWNYNNLTPYSSGHIHVVVTNHNATTIGDSITNSVYITPAESEYAFAEHTDIVTCSYDPNDKNVKPRTGEENYVLHGEQLEYLIRFQNTGNDTAYHVTIADTIDDVNLDIATLKIFGYSHPMTFSIEGQNIVVFRFNNIMLPDSNVNELASHGYVKYTIKPKTGLADNTVVENTAYIYFDSNPAVVTNTIHSTYVSEIIVSINEQRESDIKIYPNPTTGLLHITANESEIEKVMVHNITGKEVAVTYSTVIDFNTQPVGVYFITIVTDKGVATKKVLVTR